MSRIWTRFETCPYVVSFELILCLEKGLVYLSHPYLYALRHTYFFLSYAVETITRHVLLLPNLFPYLLFFSWGCVKRYLFILHKSLWTDQSNGSTELILVMQWVYWTYKSKRRGNLQVSEPLKYSPHYNLSPIMSDDVIKLDHRLLPSVNILSHTYSRPSYVQLRG